MNAPDATVDRWLRARHLAMGEDLIGLVDVEAGLREVLLQEHHAGVAEDLGAHLDVEAGLAAIVPTAGPPLITPAREEARAQGSGSAPEPDHRVAVVALRLRLELRSDPLVAVLSRAYASFLERARDLDQALDRARDRGPALARALGQARSPYLARFVTAACQLAEDLAAASTADDTVTRYAHGQALDYARQRARALGHAVDFDLARALDTDVQRARARDLELNDDLDRVRALLRALSASLAGEAVPTDALANAEELAEALARVFVHSVARAVAALLDLRAQDVLDPGLVDALAHDFTAADLSTTDLSGIELEGVRWSEQHTLWPAAIDVELLKEHSRRLPASPGTWVVTRRGITQAAVLQPT